LSTLQIALQKDDLQQINRSFSLFENEKGQQKLLCDYNFISFAILLQHVAVAEQYHLFPTLQGTWRDGSRDEEEKCAGHDLICIAYKE